MTTSPPELVPSEPSANSHLDPEIIPLDSLDSEEAKAALAFADLEPGSEPRGAGAASTTSPAAEMGVDSQSGSASDKAESKPSVDAAIETSATDASEVLPALPALPIITPLPPLPSVADADTTCMTDLVSTFASISTSTSAFTSTNAAALQPSSAAGKSMTEEDVDAAIQAEMAELKAEIAALRSSIGDTEDVKVKADTVGDNRMGKGAVGEDGVLRMAELKLDYVEKSFHPL